MYKFKKAFSLIELLVSMSIMAVLLSVVLWNYGDFNDQLALSAAAQELALDIREAQTYGINVKEVAVDSGEYNYGYGIHFHSSAAGATAYRIFIDKTIENNAFDPYSGCGYPPTECVRRVDLRNGVIITNVCDATSCPPTGYASTPDRINLLFKRPNPDAKIYFATGLTNIDNIPASSARIQLTSRKGKIKYVIIESTGQVTIQ